MILPNQSSSTFMRDITELSLHMARQELVKLIQWKESSLQKKWGESCQDASMQYSKRLMQLLKTFSFWSELLIWKFIRRMSEICYHLIIKKSFNCMKRKILEFMWRIFPVLLWNQLKKCKKCKTREEKTSQWEKQLWMLVLHDLTLCLQWWLKFHKKVLTEKTILDQLNLTL